MTEQNPTSLEAIGLDTGFFFRLLEGHPRAVDLWPPVAAGEQRAVVSCITLYELERSALRGALPREAASGLLAHLPALCDLVWLTESDQLLRAARLAHGNGLAMADALILASLLDHGAQTVYTTDPDLTRYDGPTPIEVI